VPDIPFVPEHKLIAYADGFLPPAEMAQVEAALTRSPALAKRVARIKQTRELAAASFDESLAQPLPGNILKAAAGFSSPFRRPLPFWYLLAGIGALCVGIVVGRFSVPSAQAPDAPRLAIAASQGAVAGPELSGFLDNAESGQELILGSRLPAEMVLSFPAHGGIICRQFKLGREAEMLNAVACREDGEWRVVILAEAHPTGEPPSAAGLAPDPVNAVIDQLIDGAPLDAAQERAALKKSWKR
jgi:hypothetical protein